MSQENKPRMETGWEIKKLSVEQFKNELFVRDVPESTRQIIDNIGNGFVKIESDFAESLINAIATSDAKVAVHSDIERGRDERELEDSKLTEFGKELKGRVKGTTFFDLASSDHSWAARIAPYLNASRYVGVDIYVPQENGWKVGPTEEYYIRDDILNFLSKLKDESGGVFYISGLEPDMKEPSREIIAYQHAVVSELWRVMRPGDLLVIGPRTIGFDFESVGFQKHHAHLKGRSSDEFTTVYTKPNI